MCRMPTNPSRVLWESRTIQIIEPICSTAGSPISITNETMPGFLTTSTCHQHQDFSWNRSFEVSCAAPDADPNFVLTAAAAAGGAAGAAASDTAAGHSASAAAADAPAVVTGAALGVAAIDPGTSDTAAAGDPAGGGSTGGVAAGLATAGEITPTNSESHDQNNGSDGSNQKTMHVSSLSLLVVISRSPNAGNGGAGRTINRSSEACLQRLNSPPFSLSLFRGCSGGTTNPK